jgi:hypothetical protein
MSQVEVGVIEVGNIDNGIFGGMSGRESLVEVGGDTHGCAFHPGGRTSPHGGRGKT